MTSLQTPLRLATLFALGLTLGLFGCKRPDADAATDGAPQPAETLTAGQLISQALDLTKTAAVAEPPLERTSTRTDREKYLEAVGLALEKLRNVPAGSRFAGDPPVSMFPIERAPEVLRLGRLFAVDLADAVDRNEPERAAAVLRAAFNCSDYLSTESVSASVAAAGVADMLGTGLVSVGKQLDSHLSERLIHELDRLESVTQSATAALDNERARLAAWCKSLSESKESKQIDELVQGVTGQSSGRFQADEQLLRNLRQFAKRTSGESDSIPADVIAQECELAVSTATQVLGAASEGRAAPLVLPDPAQHPLAVLYLSVMRPWLEAAPTIAALRLESLRLLKLHIQILALGLPDTLDSFGETAKSPVNGQPFQYRKSDTEYELLRPRLAPPKAGTTTSNDRSIKG